MPLHLLHHKSYHIYNAANIARVRADEANADATAALAASAVGRPVKRVWTREEEFTWAYFRPAGVIEATAGARKDGSLSAWEFHNYNSGGSGLETPYKVPGHQVAFHAAKSPLRQGSYRALASTANHFARESLMDELADRVGIDRVEVRRRNGMREGDRNITGQLIDSPAPVAELLDTVRGLPLPARRSGERSMNMYLKPSKPKMLTALVKRQKTS